MDERIHITGEKITVLDYEKKLHFDEHYKKLQSLNGTQKAGKLLWGEAGYVIVFILLKYVLRYLPDLQPWNHAGVWFTFCSIPFSKYDCPYIIYGLIANCYGSIRLIKITTQNHSVKDKNNGVPLNLLTDGCYAKVRHPMYGTFIILQSSLLLSLRSLIGIIVALGVVVFQYFNAKWEEKKKLIPLFEKNYLNYSKVACNILLEKWEIFVLTVAAFLSLAGFIF